MKLGLSEIILLLLIAAVVLIVFRGAPSDAAQPAPMQPTPKEIEEARIKKARSFRLRELGGVFLVIGILVLAGTLKIFDILFKASAGAVLIIMFGVIIFFLSTRK
jgi:hypothetical protein